MDQLFDRPVLNKLFPIKKTHNAMNNVRIGIMLDTGFDQRDKIFGSHLCFATRPTVNRSLQQLQGGWTDFPKFPRRLLSNFEVRIREIANQ